MPAPGFTARTRPWAQACTRKGGMRPATTAPATTIRHESGSQLSAGRAALANARERSAAPRRLAGLMSSTWESIGIAYQVLSARVCVVHGGLPASVGHGRAWHNLAQRGLSWIAAPRRPRRCALAGASAAQPLNSSTRLSPHTPRPAGRGSRLMRRLARPRNLRSRHRRLCRRGPWLLAPTRWPAPGHQPPVAQASQATLRFPPPAVRPQSRVGLPGRAQSVPLGRCERLDRFGLRAFETCSR